MECAVAWLTVRCSAIGWTTPSQGSFPNKLCDRAAIDGLRAHKAALGGRAADRLRGRIRRDTSRLQRPFQGREGGPALPGRRRAPHFPGVGGACSRIGRLACQSAPGRGHRPLFPSCLRAAGAEIQIPAAVGASRSASARPWTPSRR